MGVRKNPPKDQIKYLIFSEIYWKIDEPKTRRKAFYILEAAIRCLAKKGFDGVTLEMIAREAAVTRPLIRHYFDGLEDVLEAAIKYIRLLFQKICVDRVQAASRPDLMLKEYVQACFYWVENYRSHAIVWLAFLHKCSISSKSRELNSIAVSTGELRIESLLLSGQQAGVMNFSDAKVAAKMIQTNITGALITYVTENTADKKRYVSDVVNYCLSTAGVR